MKGLGFRVWGSGFGVKGLGFRGYRVSGWEFRFLEVWVVPHIWGPLFSVPKRVRHPCKEDPHNKPKCWSSSRSWLLDKLRPN